jgi:TPR repeat protein
MKPQDLFSQANERWDAGDLQGAFDLFSVGAKRGDASAQNTVGYFYDHGIGVDKSHEMALFWYKRSARRGDACAISNIAMSFLDDGNLEKAQKWFRRALMLGDMDAALELGKIFIRKKSRGYKRVAMKYLTLAKSSKGISDDARKELNKLISELEADPCNRPSSTSVRRCD